MYKTFALLVLTAGTCMASSCFQTAVNSAQAHEQNPSFVGGYVACDANDAVVLSVMNQAVAIHNRQSNDNYVYSILTDSNNVPQGVTAYQQVIF